ncbi:MAG TPA: SDR family NAD(P)-dependent oxidoreductase [Stellaceae bacterium]|nr:SDR family NAD(P)-dependent oxidoreductase [Stellaceae bacterium]
MRDFRGKTAFITGGASGIGLGLARTFADAGMKIALADIEGPTLGAAVDDLKAGGTSVIGIECDVADRQSYSRAAARAFSAFGKIHLLCNNAGVARTGPIWEIAESDWDWTIGVNLMGMIHGLQIFVPHMKGHGEPSHIVSTSSMAGMRASVAGGPYTATKYAMVGLSELLAKDLAGSNIGVSVFCPNNIRSNMPNNGRNRPTRFGGPIDAKADPHAAEHVATMMDRNRAGMDPREAGLRVKHGIETDQLFIFSHADEKAVIEDRFRRILSAMDAAAALGPQGALVED